MSLKHSAHIWRILNIIILTRCYKIIKNDYYSQAYVTVTVFYQSPFMYDCINLSYISGDFLNANGHKSSSSCFSEFQRACFYYLLQRPHDGREGASTSLPPSTLAKSIYPIKLTPFIK